MLADLILIFYSVKCLYLELASWTQIQGSQFCRQLPKHHSLEPAGHVPSSLHQAWLGVGLGHVSVVPLLHSLRDLVLVGLDLHNEHKCIVVFLCLLCG